MSDTPSFVDFVPAGETAVYGGDTIWQEYTPADDGGTFTTLAALPFSIGDIGFGRSGSSIYFIDNTAVYAYDIAGDTWTAPLTGVTDYSAGSSQTTGDDNGYVYSVGWDGTSGNSVVIQYNTIDGGVAYFPGPSDFGQNESRATWDSLSSRVYVTDFDSTTAGFYAFNPGDGGFAPLTPIAASLGGVSDAFCSDRLGHVFTSPGCSAGTGEVDRYTASDDSWSRLPDAPFSAGCNMSCSVTADGWLYFSDGDSNTFTRIRIH